MNTVIFCGRLTRDPEIRYSQSATPTCIASFSLAVDRKYKREGEAEADFFDCTAFGKRGEFVEKYLKKGTKILLSGHLQNNNYTNRNGEKVYTLRVIADEIEFAESKKAAAQAPEREMQPSSVGDGFMSIPDDVDDEELPFN